MAVSSALWIIGMKLVHPWQLSSFPTTIFVLRPAFSTQLLFFGQQTLLLSFLFRFFFTEEAFYKIHELMNHLRKMLQSIQKGLASFYQSIIFLLKLLQSVAQSIGSILVISYIVL